MYQIRKAASEDLSRILEIYEYARAFMAKTGNPNQWGRHNPPTVQLVEDICRGELFVLQDRDGIHGVFFLRIGEDPTYGEIFNGQWHSRQTYGTIHRIASDGSGGILRSAVAFCCELCPYLRIDTHADNRVMQDALAKLDFQFCGTIYIADGNPRLAYDRLPIGLRG